MSMFSSTNQASSSSSKTLKSKRIEKLVFGGQGITRIEGCVTFVPFSVPGDQVLLKITKKKKSYQVAKIEKLLEEGKGRRPPKCPHFTQCGGCQLQHLDYSEQLKAKQGFVQEALRIGTVPITPSPAEWGYRSHIRLNLREEGEGFKMGYIALDNRSLIEPTTCPLFLDDPSLFSALKERLAILPNRGIHSASLRLFKAEQGVVMAFSFFPKLPEELLSFPFAKGIAYKAPGKEKHLGNTTLKKNILGIEVPFSPYGFMQNNLPLSEKLYQTVVDWVGEKPQTILDLYCGVGITGALLAKQGHNVIGVEANKELSPCGKTQMVHGRVEKLLPKLLKKHRPDIIIVNPPKEGLAKEVPPLIKCPKLLYISCHPATLARDIAELSERYTLNRAEAFDMFPQTTHVETATLLTRTNVAS